MPPAKIACKGCRLSKLKCDLDIVDTGTCSRCARLGLHCFPTGPSKRGRPNKRRDVSRLGPEVRKLLKTSTGTLTSGHTALEPAVHQPTADAAVSSTHILVDKMHRTPERTCEAEAIINQLKTPAARRAWFRQVLYTVHRAKSMDAFVRCFSMARAMGMETSYDECMDAAARVDHAHPPQPEPLPPYVLEWHRGPHAITLTRAQNVGCMEWLPSDGFREVFNVRGRLEEGLLNMAVTAEMRTTVYEITGQLWAQVGPESDVAPVYAEAAGDKLIYFRAPDGTAKGPFRLRGRLAAKPQSLVTFTCLSLEPFTPMYTTLTPTAMPPPTTLSSSASRVASPTVDVIQDFAPATLAVAGPPPDRFLLEAGGLLSDFGKNHHILSWSAAPAPAVPLTTGAVAIAAVPVEIELSAAPASASPHDDDCSAMALDEAELFSLLADVADVGVEDLVQSISMSRSVSDSKEVKRGHHPAAGHAAAPIAGLLGEAVNLSSLM